MIPSPSTELSIAGLEASPTHTSTARITNQQIAEVLFNIATILQMQQGNPYRIAAYRNAARGMMALPIPVADLVNLGVRLELPGLGRRLRRKITELATTGRLSFYIDLCEETLPAEVRQLMTVPHVGPRTALRLTSQLGIHTVADLYEAARSHQLRGQYGFGPRSELRIEENARSILHAQQTDQAQPTPAARPGPQAA